MEEVKPAANRGVQLRACGGSDLDLLYRIFVDSRGDLSAAVAAWDEAQRQAFLRGQFQIQQDQYRSRYPDARFDVIVADGEVVGNLYVARGDDEILLIDINLLPEYRNRGIGGALLRDLLDEAEISGKPVSLHVALGNPAINLYSRMGFAAIAEEGVYRRMEWRPASLD